MQSEIGYFQWVEISSNVTEYDSEYVILNSRCTFQGSSGLSLKAMNQIRSR